jgi:hypothetical protein
MVERTGNIGPKYAIRLGDRRNWHRLTASCLVCGHRREMRMWQLRSRAPDTAKLMDVERRLRCMRCGNRDQCFVVVELAPPAPEAE